jgi:hypothetical protein
MKSIKTFEGFFNRFSKPKPEIDKSQIARPPGTKPNSKFDEADSKRITCEGCDYFVFENGRVNEYGNKFWSVFKTDRNGLFGGFGGFGEHRSNASATITEIDGQLILSLKVFSKNGENPLKKIKVPSIERALKYMTEHDKKEKEEDARRYREDMLKFDDEVLESNVSFKDTEVRVKHLIEYLSELDPEMPVSLDHDGWMADDDDPLEVVRNRGLFDPYEDILIINN